MHAQDFYSCPQSITDYFTGKTDRHPHIQAAPALDLVMVRELPKRLLIRSPQLSLRWLPAGRGHRGAGSCCSCHQ